MTFSLLPASEEHRRSGCRHAVPQSLLVAIAKKRHCYALLHQSQRGRCPGLAGAHYGNSRHVVLPVLILGAGAICTVLAELLGTVAQAPASALWRCGLSAIVREVVALSSRRGG